MVLPVILAGLGLTEAVWIAIMGIVRLLIWLYGIVVVGSYVRDAVTKVTEQNIVNDQNTCVEQVLARTDITAAEKQTLALTCINSGSKPATDYTTIALIGAAALIGYALLTRKG